MIFTDSRGNEIEKPDGTPVLERPAAYVVVERDGKTLMVQSGSGLWVFPGGGVEENETTVEAAVRECAEETGYAVRISDDQHLFAREQPFYHSGSQRFYESRQLFYKAELVDDTPNPNKIADHDKSRRSDWLDIGELATETLHPTVRELVGKMTVKSTA
jgi:8-oxo-dGTP pyrophosphatase MutT (NUDIX family)